MAKARKYTIDSTPWSAVVVCNRRGCFWRGFAHTKPSAYRLVSDHLRRAHDDAEAADDARQSAQRHNKTFRNQRDSGGSSAA